LTFEGKDVLQETPNFEKENSQQSGHCTAAGGTSQEFQATTQTFPESIKLRENATPVRTAFDNLAVLSGPTSAALGICIGSLW
jgi:hypothetical protein